MADQLTGSTVISATEPGDGTGSDTSDWLNITQDAVDPRFDSADIDFISTLAGTVFSGGDPYSLLTHNCPVTRRITPDGVVASYRAEVIVNRSPSLAGLYTLSAGEFEVTGPRQGTRNKSGPLLTDGKKVVELGWLPISLSVTQEYPSTPRLSWRMDNGYLYLDIAAYAALYLRGIAEVDIWTVLVEHQQGQEFPDRSIPVVAEWGADNKVDGELLIPGCVKEAFSQCPKSLFAGGGTGGTDPWTNIILNPSPPRTCFRNGCTGKIEKCVVMDDDR
jgi:hypothetical protein